MSSTLLFAIEDVASCFAGGAGVIGAIGFVALLIYLVTKQTRLRRERVEALEKLANDLGLGGPGIGWYEGFDETAPAGKFEDFQVGHSRGATWVRGSSIDIHGICADLVLADYLYKVTSTYGKRRRTVTHEFSCLMWSPTMGLPEQLSLREEGFFDRISALIGMDDIDFESSEFSKRFHVKCSDERAAYDLFDPRMMEWMLATAPPSLDLRSGTFLFRGAGMWSAEEFAGILRWIGDFIQHFPRHFVDSRVPKEDALKWEASLHK